ncbi:hypothetical protein ASA1KI_13310 [Opitutales bacterium ASA1]|nr:hypothetical protein ASA1KI_13310 [Opitutales bacterium ASA1]
MVNLSVRGPAGEGDDRLIMGFVLTGPGERAVVVRGLGPALSEFVSGAMEDPELTLFRDTGAPESLPIVRNEAWQTGPDAAALESLAREFGMVELVPGSQDAALLHRAPSGAYTAHVAPESGVGGIALAEVYDVTGRALDAPDMVNVSARMATGAGDDVLILGFVVEGSTPIKVLVRAVGPSLAAFGLDPSGVLAEPLLRVFRSVGGESVPVATNQGWTTSGQTSSLAAASAEVGAFALQPASRDAALLLTLDPGVYTAVVSGADGGTGIALAEVYVASSGDVSAPQVQAVQAFLRTVGGQSAIELRVAATDDSGVTGVTFLERLNAGGEYESLGAAAQEETGVWSMLAPGPAGASARTFLARARDAAGNVGVSADATFSFAAPVQGIAAIGPDGRPLAGGLVAADDEGNLAPFALVTGSEGASAASTGVLLGFPAGGRIVEREGRQFVQFSEATASFGKASPLQFGIPLVRGGAAQTFGRRSGAVRVFNDETPDLFELPVDGITPQALAAAFGLPPDEGIPVSVFGVFSLRWLEGTLTARGIEGAVFAVDIEDLPLPAASGAYASFVLDLSDASQVRLPFHGEFPLPEAIGPGVTVRVPQSRPIVLTLRADGTMALDGRVQLLAPGGGRYTADIGLDDPVYRFALAATGIEVPFLDSFSELLPDDAPGLVPPTTDDVQMDFATRALESYARAFREFSAAAVAAAPIPDDLEDGGDRPPADAGSAFVRVLDAWGFAAASPVVREVADDAVRDALLQLVRLGSGSTDLVTSTEHLAAAARLRAVLNDPAFDAAQPGARAQLDEALVELERAVIARAREPSASASLDSVFAATKLLLDVDAARQLLGFDELSPELREATVDLYRRFLDDFARSLDVQSGQFDPAGNPRIAGLNRYLAFEYTRRLIDALAALQILGIADSFSEFGVPGDELFVQLAARGASAVRAEMAEAEAVGDSRTFLDLYVDLMDFDVAREIGLFPETPAAVAVLETNGVPQPFDHADLVARYAGLFEADLALEAPAGSAADAMREVARINRMVDRVPGALGFAITPAQRVLERLDEALGVAILNLQISDDADALAELIDAGTQHARLVRRLQNATPAAAPWETDRLVDIVDRFVVVGSAEKAWAEMHRGARELLVAADQLALEVDDPNLDVDERTDRIAARRQNLVQAARLIQAARGVAVALWLETEAKIAAAGGFGIDALLPGDIAVRKAAGAFAYNRRTGAWNGTVSGSVDLPGLLGGASLTLQQATFSSSGEYEAVAFGRLDGVPLGGLTGDLEVPARRPLRIKNELFRPLAIAGGAKLTLSNGIFFEGYLDFKDPVYRFGAAAGGVRFDLADKLTAYVPSVAITLPFSFNAQNEVEFDPAFQALTKETAAALDAWFASLGATMDPVAGLLEPPALGTPGMPPEFQEPAFTFEFDGVNAFFNGLARDAALELDAGYAAILETVKDELARAALEAERAPSIGDDIAVYLQTLRRAEEMRRISERMSTRLDELAVEQAAGIESTDVSSDPRVIEFHEQARAQVEELFANPITTGDLDNARRVISLALQNDSAAQALNLESTFLARAPTFLDATYGSFLEDLGLDRQTGTVGNPVVFESLTQLQLIEGTRRLNDLQADIAFAGSDAFPESFLVANVTLGLRIRALAIAEYSTVAPEDWERRTELLQRIARVNNGILALELPVPAGPQPRLGGGSGAYSPIGDAETIAVEIEDVVERREEDLEARTADPLYAFLAELRRLTGHEFAERTLAQLRREIQIDLDRHLPTILGLLPTDAFPDSRRILGDLLSAADAAAELGFVEELDRIGRVAIPNLTVKIAAIAEAQKAWWLLSEYTGLLIVAGQRQTTLANQVLRQAVEGSIAHTLEFSRRVSAAIAADVAARIAADVEPFELRLPGDLVVRRVFGDFVFERNIPRFTATFGGYLEFPEIDTEFFIDAATISTDGSFALDVRTKGPIDAGGDDLRYTMALRVNGSPGGVLQDATGTGELHVRKAGSAEDAPEDVYEVTVAYVPGAVAPAPVFRLQTSAEGVFVFDDDLVAFEASSFLQFTRAARTGVFGLGGTVGTIAKRENFTRDDVEKKDFRLLFEDVQMSLAYRENGFGVTLEEGRVVLDPEIFEVRIGSFNCDDLESDPEFPEERQSPFAALLTPITADVEFVGDDETRFAFRGAPGGTRISFGNFGFEIPGVSGLIVDVCEVELLFPEDGLPRLADLDARLTIPLEGEEVTVPLPGAAVAAASDDGLVSAQSLGKFVRTRLGAKNWGLDGLPEGLSVTLLDDLEIVEEEAIRITVLGESCEQSPTSLALAFEQSGSVFTTTVSIAAGVRVEVDTDVLFDIDAQSGAGVAACGEFSLASSFDTSTGTITLVPSLALTQLEFCGRFRVGGENGFEVTGAGGAGTNACIQLIGLDNVFAPGPEADGRSFAIGVTGRTGFDQLGFFTLDGARFVFEGEPLPRFRVASFQFETGEALNLFQQELMPLRISQAGICFVNPDAPLDQLFAPQNVVLLVSGEVVVGIPGFDASEGGDDAALPRLAGGVECLRVAFPNGFNGLPTFSIDGLVLQLENLSIGDLGGITGALALGNINDPANLFFAGKAGASMNGVGLTVIFAATLQGPIGLCLDVNAGPAGIPIDGGSLGGVLLTGAAGGVSFGSRFADPCDFNELLGLRPDGRPPGSPEGEGTSGLCECGPAVQTSAPLGVLAASAEATGFAALADEAPIPASLLVGASWEQLAQRQRTHEAARAAASSEGAIRTAVVEERIHASAAPSDGVVSTASDDDPPDLDERCPSGDCPPPTINLLCQPHPSIDEEASAANYDREFANRVIFKFSSFDREAVDSIVAELGLDLSALDVDVATLFSAGARGLLESLIPRPCDPASDDTCALDANLAASLNQAIDEGLDGFEAGMAAAITEALGGADSVLEALYKAAYGGVPCLDITIVLEGTISHSVVSSFLSVTGGVVSSSTGTAGVLGSINLIGVPVGTAELFFSTTDRNGAPNPSLCGGAFLGIGPLELGSMDFVFECESCNSGILIALTNFVAGVANDGGAQVDGLLRIWIAQAAGVPTSAIDRPLVDYFGIGADNGVRLTDEQQIAVMANLYNLPALASALGGQTPTAASQLHDRVFDLLVEVGLAVNPTLGFCGQVAPKIFGIPLGEDLFGANLFYGRIEDGGVRYDELAAQVNFSPSWFLLNYGLVLGSGGNIPPFIPGFDRALMGFATRVEAFDATTMRAFLENPVVGSLDRMQQVVENAILTFGYQLEPFGIRLSNGQARMLVPQFDYHPNNPQRIGGTWELPPTPEFATRREVLEAALDNLKIQDATWRGRVGQLGELFSDPGLATRMNTKDLARDYFPHGGLIGASQLLLPRPITDLPPEELLRVFDATRTLEQRFSDLAFVFENYLTATTNVGRLAMYFPAPNPPTLLWNDPQNPPDAMRFVEALKSSDAAAILASGRDVELYAFDQVFMLGEAGVRVLGVPVANGEIELDGAAGLFRLKADVPPGGWLEQLLGATASLEFQIANPRYVEDAGSAGGGFLPESEAILPTQAEVFAAALVNLEGKSGAALDEALEESIAMVVDTLPRVSLDAVFDFDLPDEVANLVRGTAGASFRLFGYSPGFDPEFTPTFAGFDPLNPDPFTLARRRGGVGFQGAMQFGYFPAGIAIDVPEASLAFLLGGPDDVVPALAGLLRVDTFALPGGYTFDQGLLQFNSRPSVGGDFIHVRGRTSPIDLGPFLQVQPLNAPAPGEEPRIGASLSITNSGTPVPAIQLGIDPAQASIPMLGEDLVIAVFGSQDPDTGDFTPFTFSSVPGQPWEATMQIQGALQVRDPFDLAGPVLFEVETAGGVPFVATIEGVGVDSFTLRVTMPNGVTVRAFPGQVTEAEWTVGDANASCLLVQSNGRIYYDSGTRVVPLAGGAMEVTGRVELGFEPFVLEPEMVVDTRPIAFGSVVANSASATRTVEVRNTGLGRLVVDADVTSGNTHFTVQPNRLGLEPRQIGTLEVRYTPQSVAAHSGTLSLSSSVGKESIALSGTGTGAAAFHANPTALAFGTVDAGVAHARPLLVTNAGTTSLVISSTTVSGPYAITPTTATIAAGAAREFTVTFVPTTAASTPGSIVFATNASPASRTVSITGTGRTPLWHRQRWGGADLNGGHMMTGSIGWAVGDEGTVLRTTDGGRVWHSLGAGGTDDWSGIVFDAITANATSIPTEARGFIVGAAGRIAATVDGGASWSDYRINGDPTPANVDWRTAGRRSRGLAALAGVRTGQAYIAVEQQKDGWQVTQVAGGTGINGIAFLSETDDDDVIRAGVAVGDGGTILRTTDGGKTWSVVARPAGVDTGTKFVAVSASSHGTVGNRWFVAVAAPDIVIASQDGANWITVPPPGGIVGELSAFAFTGNTVGQLASSSGQIWRLFLASGASLPNWTFPEQFRQTQAPLRFVLHNRQQNETGGDTNRIWIVGDEGTIMRRPTTDVGVPTTTFALESLDFGAVAPGATEFRSVVVHNGGIAPATIEASIASGDDAFEVFPTTTTLGSGESAVFTISFFTETEGEAAASIEFKDTAGIVSFDASATGSASRWTAQLSPSEDDFVGAAQLAGDRLVLAAERSIWLQEREGEPWKQTFANSPGPLAAMSFGLADTGVAVGGIGGTGTPDTAKSTIVLTRDGGASWETANSPVPTRIVGVHHIAVDAQNAFGAAITESIVGTSGRVLLSDPATAPSAWRVSTAAPTQVDGRAIWSRNDGRLWMAETSSLHTLPESGGNWSKLLDAVGDKAEFRAIFFLEPEAKTGWVVGDQGNIWTTTDGGTVTGAWVNRTNASLGDVRAVHFVSQALGWIATSTAGDTRIYQTSNGGATWLLQHLEPKRPGGPEVRGFVGRAEDYVFAFGTRGGLWRLEKTSARPIGWLHLPSRIDLGTVGVGREGSGKFPIVNLGTQAVQVLDIAVDGASPNPFSRHVGDTTIPAGGGGAFEVRFRPTSVGEFSAVLRVASDAANGDAEIEVIGRAVLVPSSVVVDSVPAGAVIRIGGVNTTAPAVLPVVSSPAGAGEWPRGEARTLQAPVALESAGVRYVFSHWSAGGPGSTVTVTPGDGVQRYTARFVQSLPEPATPQTPPTLLPNPCATAAPPADVAQGPWVKISQAEVRFPTLDGGHRAAVEGSLFLSLARAEGVLRTSRFRLTSQPPSGGFELVEVTAGSWRMDLVGTDFRFVGNNPGVELFGRPTTPPSTFSFRAAWDPTTPFAPPLVAGEFATLGVLPVVPDLVEFGPSTVQFAVSPTVGLGVSGTVNLLRRPDNPAVFFYANRPFAYALGDPTPVQGSGTTTLVDFGFARLRGDATSQLVFEQDAAGVFTVGATGLLLDGWGLGSPANRVGATFTTSGVASFTLDPPASGLQLGAIRFKPKSQGDRTSSLVLDLFQRDFRVEIPPSFVNSTVGFWANDTIGHDGLVIDSSADFEVRVPLPSSLGGIAVDGGDIDDNHLIYERKGGSVGFRARAAQELLLGDMTLRFSATSDSVDGTFSGTARVPVTGTRLGSIAISYDSDAPSFQFSKRFGFTLGDYRVQFGTGGARLCNLVCFPGDDLADCDVGLCAP